MLAAPYAASKGGLWMLTRSMAIELGVHGIAVNLLAPGPILVDKNAARYKDPAVVAKRTQAIPLRPYGRVEEVAAAALFLASDECQFMTGSALTIDGGNAGEDSLLVRDVVQRPDRPPQPRVGVLARIEAVLRRERDAMHAAGDGLVGAAEVVGGFDAYPRQALGLEAEHARTLQVEHLHAEARHRDVDAADTQQRRRAEVLHHARIHGTRDRESQLQQTLHDGRDAQGRTLVGSRLAANVDGDLGALAGLLGNAHDLWVAQRDDEGVGEAGVQKRPEHADRIAGRTAAGIVLGIAKYGRPAVHGARRPQRVIPGVEVGQELLALIENPAAQRFGFATRQGSRPGRRPR